jgi:uncharacterized membrane protein YkoI
MRMKRLVLSTVILAGIGTAGFVAAQDKDDKDSKEQKVTLEQLPAAVQAAVKEQSKGATVKGFAIEHENGKKLYEAELTVDGHAKDISFDEKGAIVSIEEETALDKIPAPARAAFEKAARNGKIVVVEVVTEDGKTSYEAQISNGKKTSEVAVDAAGHKVD